jgi:hypothetical protein
VGGLVNSRSAGQPTLLALGDTPWLGWVEAGELRVARLSAAGTAWQQPASVALNAVRGAEAAEPALFAAGGIPFAAWSEGYAGGRRDVRVARLEPDFLGTSVAPSATGATVISRLQAHGLSYPVSFAYGPAGSALAARTAPVNASGGEVDVTAVISGLQPRTSYEVRPVVAAGAGAGLLGPVVGFTTTKRNGR